MKLEAMNGNILPIVKMPQEQISDEADMHEANDDEELPEVMDDEESADAKKKKQTRKKRSLNWEEAERCLLLEVIKPKVDYVENRSVDAKNIKSKRLAWLQITKQFNALNFRHRSLEQIQVQWRSMKNTAKREYLNKNPKARAIDSTVLLNFMEVMQKEPSSASTRSQTRAPGIKKEEAAVADIDEDLPLAALPTASEDSLSQTQSALTQSGGTAMTLPSPPPSAESQNDSQHQLTASSMRHSNGNKKKIIATATAPTNPQKRQKSQNTLLDFTLTPTTPATAAAAAAAASAAEDVLKKELFDLMKRARLAEMDYVRREHEQKLRLQQMEQELRLNYYRKQEELKLHQMRTEHEARMQHSKLEHEARMKAYAMRTVSVPRSPKAEVHNSNVETAPN